IEQCGAAPVLADIEPDYYTLDPARAAAAITPRTRAIIPVHLYGQPADLEALGVLARSAGLAVIEDCAQAHGARLAGRPAGSWGEAAAFSFYPTKNLGAVGDGGLVATQQPEIAERVRLLREYGWRERYISAVPGGNSRLDELQAAILRVKLRYLAADNGRRRALAALYDAGLAGLPLGLPRVRPGAEHVYHLYVVRSARRDALQAGLRARGVGSLVHYPVPVHLQPAYRGRLGEPGSFPEAERAAQEVLSLPLYPELTDAQAAAVVAAVREVVG
ncbi:MAG: DegT/DnrJ/EryC1/StrS family aminotransferase, partial [Anaerolineales bacterium]|nr:DegT/DnrJ/EryC1/StrS family aminotransferase [Anaerolineales bacterium]